jgi:integrase
MTDFGKVRERRTASGETRYWVDLRTEVARLGRSPKKARIYSMPTFTEQRPFRTRDDAEFALSHIRSEVSKGVPLVTALETFRATGESHVLTCAKRFIEYQRERADAGDIEHLSVDRLRGQIEKHWKPKWEGVTVFEVSTARLDDWAHEMRKGGLSPAMTVAVLAGMRSLMSWMRRRQELSVVPDFPSIKIPEHAPRLLSREQQDAVLEEIAVERRGIFLALADLWLRPNEGRALRPEVYEPVKQRGEADPAAWMTIKRAAGNTSSTARVRDWTKTGMVRTLPVSDRLAGWIAEYVPAHARVTQEFLFLAPRGTMYPHGLLQRTWQRACKEAGVPEVPVREGTRHSSATIARREKWPLDLIQLFLGHADAKTSKRYSKHHDLALVDLVRGKRATQS